MGYMISNTNLIQSGYTRFLAPAKLNLFLKVLNKRSDGYHNLQSVFQLIDLYDEIYIKIRNDNKINFKNNIQNIKKELDLGFKAAKLILKDKSIGVDIFIKKNIPIGAGLGGGSSDAATTLMAINALGAINFNKKKLMQFGIKLGADVPFFIYGKNAWVEGIGEKISSITIPQSIYYLCIPQVSLSTQSIFNAFKLTKPSIPLKMATYFDTTKYNSIQNDLEIIASKKYIQMSDLLRWLKSFGYARMSGSGSSVFLKIKDLEEAKLIEKEKPANIRSFIVKGLKIHPFDLV